MDLFRNCNEFQSFFVHLTRFSCVDPVSVKDGRPVRQPLADGQTKENLSTAKSWLCGPIGLPGIQKRYFTPTFTFNSKTALETGWYFKNYFQPSILTKKNHFILFSVNWLHWVFAKFREMNTAFFEIFWLFCLHLYLDNAVRRHVLLLGKNRQWSHDEVWPGQWRREHSLKEFSHLP